MSLKCSLKGGHFKYYIFMLVNVHTRVKVYMLYREVIF